MVVRPNRPKHDELVQEASFLPARKLKGALKSGWDIIQDAMKLEREGASQREIFDETSKLAEMSEETGIWRDPTNQWIFELGDTSKIKPKVEAELSTPPKFPGTPFKAGPLSRLIDNKLLFERLPWTKNIQTELMQPHGQQHRPYGGQYSADQGAGRIQATGKFELAPNSGQQWSLRDTLTHEIQHPIQELEGLPWGTNRLDPTMNLEFMNKMVPHLREMSEKMMAQRNAYMDDQLQKGATYADALFNWEMNNPRENALLNESLRLGGRAGSFQPRQVSMPPANEMARYQASTGEQQAELNAARKDYDIDMRRAEPVFENVNTPLPVQMSRTGKTDFEVPHPDTLTRFLQKGSLAGAGAAGTAGAASAAEAPLAPKGDRLGQPSKDEVMANRLELARIRSAEADRRHTGADQPAGSNYDITPLAKSAATGAKHSTAETLGAPGDLQALTGIGPTSRIPGKLPSSEEMLAMINKLLPADYESKGPVEESYRTLGELLLDPVNLLGGAIGKVRKLF